MHYREVFKEIIDWNILMVNKTYIGRIDRSVYIDDGEGSPYRLNESRSQKLWNHSPDGFNWGYGSSGPSQLALAILLDYLDSKELALANYQGFKFDVISHLTKDQSFKLTSDELDSWIEDRQTK